MPVQSITQIAISSHTHPIDSPLIEEQTFDIATTAFQDHSPRDSIPISFGTLLQAN